MVGQAERGEGGGVWIVRATREREKEGFSLRGNTALVPTQTRERGGSGLPEEAVVDKDKDKHADPDHRGVFPNHGVNVLPERGSQHYMSLFTSPR